MRQILEDLIFLGNLKETYKLFNKEWTLRTLTSDENLQVTNITSQYDQLSRINAIKIATLARSIVEIDNTELKDLDEKVKFLSKLQQPIIDLLYAKYNELLQKQNEEMKNLDEDLKN